MKIFALTYNGVIRRGVAIDRIVLPLGEGVYCLIEGTEVPVLLDKRPLPFEERTYFIMKYSSTGVPFLQEAPTPFSPDEETHLLLLVGEEDILLGEGCTTLTKEGNIILISPRGWVRINGKVYHYSHLPCGRWELVEEGVTVEAVIPSD